ncbi:MAG TPA: hypothetical protein VKS98_07790 [Chthoniobacterales bacterium]|nr:hypothetical protein [Chthoniobacterales bacterium]
MKRSFFLSAVLLATVTTLIFAAPVRYEAKVWRAVQTYDLVSVSKNLDAHNRELMGVKCNFRGKDIHHMKPNWYESSLWQPIPGESGKFAHLSVMVAKPDLNAFKSIPTDSSGAEVTIYGRIEYDVASKFRFLRLVGRNATVDSAGNASVSW